MGPILCLELETASVGLILQEKREEKSEGRERKKSFHPLIIQKCPWLCQSRCLSFLLIRLPQGRFWENLWALPKQSGWHPCIHAGVPLSKSPSPPCMMGRGVWGGHLHRICSGTGFARWAAPLKIVAAGQAGLEQMWQVSPTKAPEGPLLRSGRICPKGRATVPASLGPPSSTPGLALSFLPSRGAPPRS